MSLRLHSRTDEHPQQRNPVIIGTAIATTTAAVIFICVRIYVRSRLTHNLGWDDGLITAAGMLSVSGAVFNSLSFSNGAGIHVENLSDPTKQVSNIIKWNTAYQVDNVVCVNLIKLSILVFVLRFFRPKSLRYVIYFMMFAMSTVNIISASFILAQCRPLEKLWNPEKPGYCAPEGFIDPIGYVQCSVNILTDFFCTITPLCILWNVRIKKKLKFAIATLMSLGILASAAGLVRLFTLNTLKSPDYSYDIIAILLSAIIEQNLGIIAACMPTYAPLYKKIYGKAKTIYASLLGRRYNSKFETPEKNGGEPSHRKKPATSRFGRQMLTPETRPTEIKQDAVESSITMTGSSKGYHAYVTALNQHEHI